MLKRDIKALEHALFTLAKGINFLDSPDVVVGRQKTHATTALDYSRDQANAAKIDGKHLGAVQLINKDYGSELIHVHEAYQILARIIQTAQLVQHPNSEPTI